MHYKALSILALLFVFVSTSTAVAETYLSVEIVAVGTSSNVDLARTKAGAQLVANCQKVCHDANGCAVVTSEKGGTPVRVTSFCSRKGSSTTLLGTCTCKCNGSNDKLSVPSEYDAKNCLPGDHAISGFMQDSLGYLE